MAVRPAYFVREAASNLGRNFLMFVAAAVAVAISLSLFGAVLLFQRIVSNVTTQWQNDVVMNVFLKDDAAANSADVKRIGEEIQGYKEVKGVTYVTKNEAYDEFRTMFGNQPELVESVTPETLPASFRVSLNDNDTLETVQDRIRTISGVDEVNSAVEQVKSIQRVLTYLQVGVMIAGIVLLVSSVVLISNTIRLAIFARRKEIAIMKLVGATNWFIRWPFLLEGAAAGIVGVGLAVALTFLIRYLLTGWESIRFVPLNIPFGYMLWPVTIVLVLVAMLISVGGTAWALRRYLDV
ncbi:MAG: permease-like cell division protein FtsX [Acidimicrobiia bacterium]|nr:permease-like cell division protein FtsX [Acidimicrobiia bacterium]